LCERRIHRRLGHPTIRPVGGTHPLGHMAAPLEPPRRDEGLGAVRTVRSYAAAWQTALLLGNSNVNCDTKFPRTPHLLDLGAATPADVVFCSARSSASPYFSLAAEVAAAAVIQEKTNGANMAFPLLPIGYSLSSSSLSCRAFSSAQCAATIHPTTVCSSSSRNRVGQFDAPHLLPHAQFWLLAAWLRLHAPPQRAVSRPLRAVRRVGGYATFYRLHAPARPLLGI
jgi:hypothetical protein